ncbi:hypothetical protein SDC9_131025 [bioreactor metagenome]|uniref:Uncharacterized protein n=1 Tax=bioreactor metagenome TaxID=1076179 RepID=A0A645D431_9ZZZZ
MTGEARVFVAGSGIDCLKIAHGGGLSLCLPEKSQVIIPGAAVQTAGHGCSAPGRVAILIRNKAGPIPLPTVDAVQHGEQKRAPGGFAGLIGSLQNVQAVGQSQSFLIQLAKCGAHTMDTQRDHLCLINFNNAYHNICRRKSPEPFQNCQLKGGYKMERWRASKKVKKKTKRG